MILTISSTNLFEILNRYKSSPFVFVESGGNYGDFLIYRGAEKLFKLAAISYQKVTHVDFLKLEIPKDSIIYINGGGAFNNLWSPNPIDDLIKAVTSHVKAVILGPTTFTEDVSFLKDRFFSRIGEISNKRVFIFCREKVSYLTLNKIVPPDFELLLDHDTAFNLCAEDLLNHLPVKGKYKLYAIREDREQLNFERLDRLALWVDPINYCASFEEWIALHVQAKKIITNRLHSSVLSFILGKPVTLLPNSYYKNRSIWEYSLKERGVIWKDKIEVSVPASFFMKSEFYRWLSNSYKVRRLYGLV